MQPLLLCVNMDPARMMRISFCAAALGISVREVKKEAFGQTIGALCRLDEPSLHPSGGNIGAEMMVMAFFSDWLMDDFFAAVRKSGLEPPRLKAVLTPVNRNWTCARLYEALSHEDAAMNQRRGP